MEAWHRKHVPNEEVSDAEFSSIEVWELIGKAIQKPEQIKKVTTIKDQW